MARNTLAAAKRPVHSGITREHSMVHFRLHFNQRDRVVALMALVSVIAALGALTVQQPLVTQAQNTTPCSQILPEVEKRLTSCREMDRDQVCYGNPAVSATFVDSSSPVTFAKIGDIVDRSAVKALQTTPFNLERNEWGIAALKVQVNNLDGTTTGQAATFVLFGDTQWTNASPPSSASTVKSAPPPACSASTSRLSNLRNAPVAGSQSVKVLPANTALNISGRIADGTWLFADDTKGQTGWVLASSVKLACDVTTEPVIDPNVPTVLTGLRAFYFTTGVHAQSQCKDIPQAGFMARSPTGRKVDFTVDGTDISMGSTVEFLKVGNQLIIMVLDGEITVTLNGQTVTVRAGQQLNVNVQGDPPQAVGPLPNPIPYQNPASQAVRCAVDPVINYGCNPTIPNNVTVVDNTHTILCPDCRTVVNGPKPPAPPAPAQSVQLGGACTNSRQCYPTSYTYNGQTYSYPNYS